MKHTPKSLILLFLVAAALFFGGCASASSKTAPGADLSKVKKVYVVRLAPDQRGINRLLADQLAVMGYQATTGEANAVPADIDATLTYQDKWMWDITMYMLELHVQLREARTEMALATADIRRPSLQRKSPAGMVEEALTELFKAK